MNILIRFQDHIQVNILINCIMCRIISICHIPLFHKQRISIDKCVLTSKCHHNAILIIHYIICSLHFIVLLKNIFYHGLLTVFLSAH